MAEPVAAAGPAGSTAGDGARARVRIIIVNWNAGELLRRCLASVARWSGPELARVVVVDNGSTDGSADVAVPGLPLEVRRLGYNAGFAAACNIGAEGSEDDYLLFLNPDTELLDDVLARVLAFMDSEGSGDIGICGVRLLKNGGVVQRHCSTFPTWRSFVGYSSGLTKVMPTIFPNHWMEGFDHARSRPVDHVMGAFYFVRRALFERLGGFDEAFFVYLEDLDFSRRAAQAGWGCFYLAEPAAFHLSGGTSRQVKDRRLFYSLRSHLLYAFKHFSLGAATAASVAALLVEPVSRLALAARRRSSADALATMRAYALLWRDAPNIARHIARLRSGRRGAERT